MDYWKVKTYRKETYLVKTIGLFVSCWLYTIHLKSFQKPCLILSNTCNFALESMPLRSILSLHSFWHILFRHGKKQQQQQKQTIYIYISPTRTHCASYENSSWNWLPCCNKYCCLAKTAFFPGGGHVRTQQPADSRHPTLQPCFGAIFRQIKFSLWQIVIAWPSSSTLLWHLVWNLVWLFQWYVRLPCNATAGVQKIWTLYPRLGRCFISKTP